MPAIEKRQFTICFLIIKVAYQQLMIVVSDVFTVMIFFEVQMKKGVQGLHFLLIGMHLCSLFSLVESYQDLGTILSHRDQCFHHKNHPDQAVLEVEHLIVEKREYHKHFVDCSHSLSLSWCLHQ